jgi:hypothetical protein
MSFKKIKGFKNYSINEQGQVRNDITNKIKNAYANTKTNYLIVDLWENNKSYKKSVHRLVAETFIPNPLNKPTVDHIDGNRQNNSLENLRWATFSEQNSRFNTNGLRSENILVTKYDELRKKRGGGHISWNKIIEQKVFNSITEVAKYFDLTIGSISQLLKNGEIGRRGKTRGYKFEYINSERKTHKK